MASLIECAHAECACLVPPEAGYCSEYCRAKDDRKKEHEGRDPGQLFATGYSCDCGHAECDDRVKAGTATHEQAR